MKKATIAICLIGSFLLLIVSNKVHGQTGGQQGNAVITTAVPFLNIGPDARMGGMGEVGVAIADDASATHWNNAALAFVPHKMGFGLSYTPWLRSLGIPDINLAYLSGFIKPKVGTISASLRYFSLGEIQLSDNIGTPVGTDRPNEFAVDVGYALPVSENFSASIALRYFYSRLATAGTFTPDLKPVSSFAGDISLYYENTVQFGPNLPVVISWGVNASNIGPKVSYTSATADRDFIPTNLRLGYALKFLIDEYNSVTFANDFNKLMVPSTAEDRKNLSQLEGMFSSFADAPGGFSEEISEIQASLGLEYWYREILAIRGGFFYEDQAKGNRKFVSLGAGVQYNVFAFHFSYLIPFEQGHPLQNTLRFTLLFNFDAAGDQ